MNILLFGVSNVGKTCTGKALADRLGFEFYDLDEEVMKHYSMSLEKFVKTGTLRE
jgi:shikimate kinase